MTSSSIAKRLMIVRGVRHFRGIERRKEGILIVSLLLNQTDDGVRGGVFCRVGGESIKSLVHSQFPADYYYRKGPKEDGECVLTAGHLLQALPHSIIVVSGGFPNRACSAWPAL